jgi:hypothetical protein
MPAGSANGASRFRPSGLDADREYAVRISWRIHVF